VLSVTKERSHLKTGVTGAERVKNVYTQKVKEGPRGSLWNTKGRQKKDGVTNHVGQVEGGFNPNPLL